MPRRCLRRVASYDALPLTFLNAHPPSAASRSMGVTCERSWRPILSFGVKPIAVSSLRLTPIESNKFHELKAIRLGEPNDLDAASSRPRGDQERAQGAQSKMIGMWPIP